MTGRSYGNAGKKYYRCTKRRYGKESCDSNLASVEVLDKLIWDTLFADDTVYKEVKRAYVDVDKTEMEEASKDIKKFNKIKEKYESQLPRLKKMILEELYTIKEGKAMVQEINSNITAAKEKVEEAELLLKKLQGERFLLQSFGMDMEEIIIPADVVASIFNRNAEAEDEILDVQQELAYQEMLEEQETFKITWSKTEVIESDDNDITKDFNKKLIGNDPKEKSRIIKKYIEAVKVNSIRKKKFKIKIKFKLQIENKSLKFSN